MCGKRQTRISVFEKIWKKDHDRSLVLVLRKSGIPSKRIVHKESRTMLLKRCWWNSQKAGCPIFRATSPLPRGQLKNKGHGKLSIHYAADLETVETIFRIIVSANHCQSLRSSRRDVLKITKPFTKELGDML